MFKMAGLITILFLLALTPCVHTQMCAIGIGDQYCYCRTMVYKVPFILNNKCGGNKVCSCPYLMRG